MDIKKIQEILKEEPKFRAKQVYEAIFKKFIEDWDEATNLPQALRQNLKENCPLDIKAEALFSHDKKTVKAAIDYNGQIVESVLMRHGDGRNTVCVSTQIGCRMNCDFCLTGSSGFERDLDFYEIVTQVLFFSRLLKKETSPQPSPYKGEGGERVSNVVFMGMGEPFMNYAETMKAVRFLNDKDTFNIGARKISISTCGLIDGIKKFGSEPLQINLALSLHAPNDGLRGELMPIARSCPLRNLLTAVANYIKKTNRKVMIEYVMLHSINDHESDALELAAILKKYLGRLFAVNLIAYNSTGKYRASSPERIKKFKEILENKGLEVIERFRFGREIKGACGQLRRRKQ